MIKPERAALEITARPAFRPPAVGVRWTHPAVLALIVLALAGVAAYVVRLLDWGNRPAWAYQAAFLMYLISAVVSAPLVAYVTRATRAYWGLPVRRVSELFIVPALASYLLLIPILAALPPLEGRANLWFDFGWGPPFLTDALAAGFLLLNGVALLWVGLVPDLAGPPSAMSSMPAWKRALLLNWTGTPKQWSVIKGATKLLGAFFLMSYIFTNMIVSTDLGQSLLPGWRSGIFPAYHALSGIQGGIALTIIALWFLRRFTSAGRFIGNEQAINLGKLLLATTLLWFYFFWSDFLLVWYARLPGEVMAMQVQVAVVYLTPFLVAFSLVFLFPFAALIFNPVRRRLGPLALVASMTVVGLLFDRIRYFVAPMSNDNPFQHRLAALPAAVMPDAIDVVFLVGWVAIVAVLFLLAASRLPVLSGWEMRQTAMLRREEKFMKGHVMVLGKPD